MSKRLLIAGLDCAEPSLVFDKWRGELKNLSRLMGNGVWGRLRSTHPPITVPAWTSMMTGKNPGKLGFYGFRNRKDYTYDGLDFATSTAVTEPTVWDIASKAGKKVSVIGVPQTYPPKPVNGNMISCFLTPDAESEYSYPKELKAEIQSLVGEYMFDVEDFRTEDKEKLIGNIYKMSRQHFEVVRHLMKNKPWDFFMFVEMGIDRVHHGFWKYFDVDHPKYEAGNPLEGEMLKYYKYIDEEIGSVLELAGDAAVMVVSDHGARAMLGGICINEWLIQEGYLSLKEAPAEPGPLRQDNIDWPNTKAWAAGGYYGRLFINVKDREPEGVVPQGDYEKFRNELADRIEAIPDQDGKPLGTKVYKPEELYPTVKNIAPDLFIYFGNLAWRSVGSVGMGTIRTFENDTGPDDANHAFDGIFILSDPERPSGKELYGLDIKDVASTALDILGLEPKPDMEGKIIGR